MAFEQDLRAHLEGLEQAGTFEPARPLRQIDEHELRQHFLRQMRRLESDGEPVLDSRSIDWADKLPRFARYLEALPIQQAPLDRAGALAFACRTIDVALDCREPDISQIERFELCRIVDAFLDHDLQVDIYALENHLVRLVGGRRLVTELGRVFLRLRGRDALRWLLTNEVSQSAGDADPWRAPRELFEEAMRDDGSIFVWKDDRGLLGYSGRTVDRLINAGILEEDVDPAQGRHYVARHSVRETLQAVLDPGPWHTAIHALLDDERAIVLPGASPGAGDATIEQTKLIAHEVRNALIPVRHDIDALRALKLEPSTRRRVDDARDGVVRVLDFVEAMVQASELITEPLSSCDLGLVVEEALGWIDTARRVERLFPSGALLVLAPRTRLARAISNVVGNALQATSGRQPVRVSLAQSAGIVRIVVDDGGPGVPIEHRCRVFQEGVTMRKDGVGSGFGLAFAQRVVESTLQGRIWCEDSDLGGARFVIEIPASSAP